MNIFKDLKVNLANLMIFDTMLGTVRQAYLSSLIFVSSYQRFGMTD